MLTEKTGIKEDFSFVLTSSTSAAQAVAANLIEKSINSELSIDETTEMKDNNDRS